MHTSNGNNFIYDERICDDGYVVLDIYDLNDETPWLVGKLNGSELHYNRSGKTGSQTDLLTNPEHFILDTISNLLSNLFCSCTYYTDIQSGWPVPMTPYYEYDGYFVMTSKVSLKLSLPEEGRTEVFPAGTEFAYYRTDNATYVDLKLDDGRICRVYVEYDNGEQTIDGMDIYDVFDGIIFAG